MNRFSARQPAGVLDWRRRTGLQESTTLRVRIAAHCKETIADELQPSCHLATVHPLHPEKHLPEREEALEETWLVGSLFWTLEKCDVWLLGTESAFLFTDC